MPRLLRRGCFTNKNKKNYPKIKSKRQIIGSRVFKNLATILVSGFLVVAIFFGSLALYKQYTKNVESEKKVAKAADTIITPSNISNGTCTPNPAPTESTLTCLFPLVNGISEGYVLPGRTRAKVSTSPYGYDCEYSKYGGTDYLRCVLPTSNLSTYDPSATAQLGTQTITIDFNGTVLQNKANIVITATPITGSNISTGSNCSPNFVSLGSTTYCYFQLTGAEGYTLPGKTTASITTASGASSDCQVWRWKLWCYNVPTTGGTLGSHTVTINLNGTIVDSGVNVTITTPLAPSNIYVGLGTCAPYRTVVLGATANCDFPVSPGVYTLPGPTTASITTATGSGSCSGSPSVFSEFVEGYLWCTNIPTTGGTLGRQTVNINLNGTIVATTADVTILGAITPITDIELKTTVPNCGNPRTGSTTTCTFLVLSTQTGISSVKMFVDVDTGLVAPGGTCTLASVTSGLTRLATCTGVPVGNSVGVNNVYAQLSATRNTTQKTQSKVYVVGADMSKFNFSYSPIKSSTLAANYKGGQDISISLNNLRTTMDPKLLDDSYTCKFEVGSFGKDLTDTTGWTTITGASAVAYNETTNSCTTTFTDAQKKSVFGLNVLPLTIRVTVTPTNATDPTGRTKVPFVLSDSYAYRINGVVS